MAGRNVTPGNHNKRNGTERENRVRALLEDDGYFVVRSAGSGGVADLVALKPGQVLLVQCKSEAYLAPGPWNDLFFTAENVRAVPLHAAKLPGSRRVVWHRLTGPKTVVTKRPPWVEWSADQVGAR
jgi:Holliday junction resolvase